MLVALAAAIASWLLPATAALGAWSGASQVVGFSEGKNVVAGIDDGGTQQLGFLATGSAPEGQGLYDLTRAAGVSAWTSKRVFGPINNGRFAFARNGAGVVAWQGSGQTVWAAYRPAGKAWGAPAQLDDPPRLGVGPLPVISAAGQAAVIWSRKTALANPVPDQVVYSAATIATASWPGAPSLLASIALPQPVDADHFNTCLPGSGLVAGILPSGTPIAAWNDAYGSFKEEATDLVPPIQSGHSELGLCGVKIATPADTTAVTPRPAVGWNAAGTGALPFWHPVSLDVDPDSGETALVLRGNEDAVTEDDAECDFAGIQESDYCFDTDVFETRVSLGTGTSVPHPGTLTASLDRLALRNGFVAAATGSSTTALKGGVGPTLSTASLLSPDAVLTFAAIAVGAKGEAELLIHNGTKLIAYSAAAGGQFGSAVDIQSGSQGTPSVAIGCNGDALAAWNRGSSGVFAAVSLTGAAQCEGSGPGDPGPTGGGPSTPTSSAPAPSAGAATVAPTPTPKPTPAPKPQKCKKGFQKKTVRGKAKCVKKPQKGKKR